MDVMDVNRLPFDHGATGDLSPAERYRSRPEWH